jgi:signal transduction histidine kinase
MRAPDPAQRVATGAALVGGTIALVALAGWAADVDAMRRVFVGPIHMLPNTAVGILLATAALLLQRAQAPRSRAALVAARACATLVLVLGAITFVERATGWNAGIDLLLFPDLVRRHPYLPPGRMATNSTLVFTFAGAALLTLDRVTPGGRRPARWLASLGLAIAALALIGYLYGVRGLYTFDAAAAMAVPTACAFFLVHLSILAARPDGGWMGLLVGRDESGVLARKLLFAVIAVPLLLGIVLVRAREADIVGRETGVAMFVVATIAILLTVTMRGATAVRTSERARQATLEREALARAEAERATRAKSDFLAVMSHELRTPLNAIIGYGSLLADEIPGPVNDGQRRQLERIGSSARHLLALIDEVLTLSRIELGEEGVVIAPVSVATLVEDAAAMVEPQARAKGLDFVVTLPGESAVVETDAAKLRQALVNLLGNAVKFTDQGAVRLRVTVPTRDGDPFVFEVEDTGVGIAEEYLERVFDSFWQVDQAHSRKVGGVGLGLHITRQLVRLLGGDVSVTSSVGRGSCFTLRLPRLWWARATGAWAQVPDASGLTPRPSPVPGTSPTTPVAGTPTPAPTPAPTRVAAR